MLEVPADSVILENLRNKEAIAERINRDAVFEMIDRDEIVDDEQKLSFDLPNLGDH